MENSYFQPLEKYEFSLILALKNRIKLQNLVRKPTFFVTVKKNDRLFGMLGAYIERVEVLDQAFSSIKSADNIDSVNEVADILNRYNNKMKELVISEKEVKGEIMEVAGQISKEKKEVMKQMTINAGLIHRAEI